MKLFLLHVLLVSALVSGRVVVEAFGRPAHHHHHHHHHQRSSPLVLLLHPSTSTGPSASRSAITGLVLSRNRGLIRVMDHHHHHHHRRRRRRHYSKSTIPLEAASSSGSLLLVTHRHPAVAAGLGLAVSALTGWRMDQTKFLPDSGILVTLLLSSFLSKLGLVPAASPLYDLSWTLFLPASLALLLLSMNNKSKKQSNDSSSFSSTTGVNDNSLQGGDGDAYTIAASVQRVFIPFVIASFGSVLGCLFSFVLCHQYSLATPRFHTHTTNPLQQVLLLPLAEARIVLSCLTASFVGGSVNFFATANQIAATATATAIGTGTVSSSSSSPMTMIVSSMAVADIVVMLLYFALLGAALQSKTMQRWFKGDTTSTQVTGSKGAVVTNDTFVDDDFTTASTRAEISSSSTLQHAPKPKEETSSSSSYFNKDFIPVIGSATLASTLAFVVVRIASRVEQWLADFIPGLACAVIVAIVPTLKRCVNQWLLPWLDETSVLPMAAATKARRIWNNAQDIAEPLSQISFFLLFASIGVSANLAGAVRSGPACLFLSLVAMLVHLFVSIGVSLLVRWRGLLWFLPPPLRLIPTRILSKTKRFASKSSSTATTTTRRTAISTSSIRLEDVLIASNAAIGGPATAAAFCSRIRGPRQEGLTYAAVVWGVFGYAIGTTMGILFYRFLGYAFNMT
jgi:uncharacterized membrane protein